MSTHNPTEFVEASYDLDKVGDDVATEYDRIAIGFMAKDAEWHAYNTKRLLWKIDLRLLPWLVLMYTTNFLDRTCVALSSLWELSKAN